MRDAHRLRTFLAEDAERRRLLALLRAHGPAGAWIGAGFVRNAVWDRLHGRPPAPPAGDVDVLWFDPATADPEADRAQEARLAAAAPGVRWSVKNQARMHRRNGDAPYAGVADAMRHWPETATAVAVRADEDGGIEITAPFGLDDLFALVVRPTPRFRGDKRPVVDERIRAKRWLETWPRLTVAPD